MSIDWFSVFELVLRGPSGWLTLGLGTAATAAMGYITARHRYKTVRSSTFAYVGGEKGFRTCNESDVDDMFRCFDRYERKMAELIAEYRSARGGARQDIAGKVAGIAQQVIDECDDLLRMNIAFRTVAGHQRFLDQIDSHRAKAARLIEQSQGRRAMVA